MPDDIVVQVHCMAWRQKNDPRLLFLDQNEWENEDPVDDSNNNSDYYPEDDD